MAQARQNGDGQMKSKPRPVRMVRRDGREPMGLGAALGALVTERAWELPAAGASLRERSAAIAPELAGHVAAVGYDADTGRLTVCLESAAWATKTRLEQDRVIAAANTSAGRTVVRALKILAPGTVPMREPADADPEPAAAPAGPVRTGRPPRTGTAARSPRSPHTRRWRRHTGWTVDAEMLDWLEATGAELIRLATERRRRTRHLLDAHLTTVTDFISESRYTPAAGQRLHTLAASLSQAIAWQHFDERRHASAGRYWHAALHNAHTAHQRDLGAGILSDLAYQLLWLKDARTAADILEHAIPRTQHPPTSATANPTSPRRPPSAPSTWPAGSTPPGA
ncbi:hypothetical protein ACE1SV_66240 [Streptomyces sp. E-15]